MGTNRAIQPAADGAFVLRPGRFWRALLVVNGPTTCEQLEEVLSSLGFDQPVTTAEGDWKTDRPEDWPDEPSVSIAANESFVRMSGPLHGDRAVHFARDRTIEKGATYTIAAAWDYGPAPQESSREIAGAEAAKEEDRKSKLLLGVVAGLTVFGAWSMYRSGKREEKAEERWAKLTASSEREELARRVQHYLERGHSEPDATDLAEREIAARQMHNLAEAVGDE